MSTPAVPKRRAFLVGLRDLRLEGDDAFEPWAEVVHGAHATASLRAALSRNACSCRQDRAESSVQSLARDARRDTHPRRRHRPGAHRGDAPRARGDRRRLRMGRPARRRGRDARARRRPAARVHARLDPPQRRRAEGPDHDADRRGLPLRQRRAAQAARPLRAGAPVQDLPGRAHALRGHRPRDRAREHRGPLRRDRVRAGHAGHGRAHRVAERARRPAAARGRRDHDQADLDHRHPATSSSSRSTTPAGWAAARSRPSTRRTS